MFLKLFCKEQSAFCSDCLNSVFISKNFLTATTVLYLRNSLLWASHNTWTVIFTASNATGPCRTPVGWFPRGGERRGARRRPGSIILETDCLGREVLCVPTVPCSVGLVFWLFSLFSFCQGRGWCSQWTSASAGHLLPHFLSQLTSTLSLLL